MGKLGHKLKGGFNYGKKVVNNTVAFGKKHKGKIAAVVAIGGLLLANDKMTSRNEGRERESNAIDQAKMVAAINTQRTNERNKATAQATQQMNQLNQDAATANAKRLMSANTAITHSHGAARDNLVSHLASRPGPGFRRRGRGDVNFAGDFASSRRRGSGGAEMKDHQRHLRDLAGFLLDL